MEELYRFIEQKIKDAGFPGEISGEALYNDICDEMEDKENGSYLLMIKGDGVVHFECRRATVYRLGVQRNTKIPLFFS